MKIKMLIVNLLMMTLLVSCATSYQQYNDNFLFGSREGYSDYQIDENTFSVSFRANEFTSGATVYAYALRRAAEVVKKNGFKYFEVVTVQNKTTKESRGSYGPDFCIVTTHNFPALTLHVKGYHYQPSTQAYSVDEVLNKNNSK